MDIEASGAEIMQGVMVTELLRVQAAQGGSHSGWWSLEREESLRLDLYCVEN